MRFEFLIEFSPRFIIIFLSLAATQETVGFGGVGGGEGKKGGERVLKDMFYFYFIYSATPGIPASILNFRSRNLNQIAETGENCLRLNLS